MKRVILFLFAASFGLCTYSIESKPNIIFVLLDDLGKEWISCYGADGIETPNIDKLAASGMKFNNAYSMPQCTPSRACFLTGQYPFRNGWVNHWDVPRWGVGYFDWNKNPGIGRMMKAAGYRTAVAGKWQLNDFREQPDAMVKHGFDEYCMWTGGEAGNKPSNNRYWDPYIHTKNGSRTYEGKFGPDIYNQFILDFISANKETPFIVSCPETVPAGVTSDALIDFTDMMTTFADFAGSVPEAGYVYDGFSAKDVFTGKAKESGRKWNLAMGGHPGVSTDAGIESVYYFRNRVIREKRFKLFVGINRKPVKLVDVIADPAESKNLLDNPEYAPVVTRLYKPVEAMPEKDNDPVYTRIEGYPVYKKARKTSRKLYKK